MLATTVSSSADVSSLASDPVVRCGHRAFTVAVRLSTAKSRSGADDQFSLKPASSSTHTGSTAPTLPWYTVSTLPGTASSPSLRVHLPFPCLDSTGGGAGPYGFRLSSRARACSWLLATGSLSAVCLSSSGRSLAGKGRRIGEVAHFSGPRAC